MKHTGKVATLPLHWRNEASQRLEDGQTQQEIADWLNSEMAKNAPLNTICGGVPFVQQNISNWENTGHKDWRNAKFAKEAATSIAMAENAEDFNSSKTTADNLAHWLTGKLVARLADLDSTENQAAEQYWTKVREIIADLATLRRGNHESEWLRLAKERIRIAEEKEQNRPTIAAIAAKLTPKGRY